MIISFLLYGVFLLGVVSVVLYRKFRTYSFLSSIKKRYARQAEILLNYGPITTETKLNKEQRKKILAMPIKEWQVWQEKVSKVKSIAKDYGLTFSIFLKDNFPGIENRKSYKHPHTRGILSTNYALIDTLTIDELTLILADDVESWQKRVTINQQVEEIKKLNLEGLKTYYEVEKVHDMKSNEIIRNRRRIEFYQSMFIRSKIYDGWIEKQSEYAEKFRKIYKESRSNDGRFTYQVPFSHIDKYGNLVHSEYKVWQGFMNSYSYFCDELQPNHMLETKKNLPKIRTCFRSFLDDVHKSIYKIIEEINCLVNSKPLIVFVNSSKYQWEQSAYDYQYRKLQSILVENSYDFVNIDSLSSIKKDSEYSVVVLVDILTENDDLINNCRLIAEYFEREQPYVTYYTYLKEMSEDEVKRFFKKDSSIKESPSKSQEQMDLEFIKTLFEEISLNSHFSYLAITNTLIGTSKATKEIWLNNPELYQFMTEDIIGKVAGKYSIDSGVNFKSFIIDGDRFKLDDVVSFTYRLFDEMGVLQHFRDKGKLAIKHMNEKQYLSYRK